MISRTVCDVLFFEAFLLVANGQLGLWPMLTDFTIPVLERHWYMMSRRRRRRRQSPHSIRLRERGHE